MCSARPETLGRYVIEAELGRGAMGVVYRARDPRIDRPVALKTLYPARADDAAAAMLRERFLNEGRAAGRLSHRGIVAVYDADVDAATGIAYLAMELVEGGDLRGLMDAGIEPARLIAVLTEVAAALDHAHQRGVVHRDVKPANILIDSDGAAHLTDFGIARLGDSTLTQDGEFLGTPAYMAPEQVRSRPVSAATDVYALAVVAYEGLTSSRPFGGDSMVATATSIAADEPPAPSVVAPVPPHFDAAILQALSKDPALRPASAGAFAAALHEALGASLSGSPPPKPRPAATRAPATRAPAPGPPLRRLAALFGALILVILVVVLSRRGGPERVVEEPGTSPSIGPAQSAAPTTAGGPASGVASTRQNPPPARGVAEIELTAPRRGRLVVADGGREVASIVLDTEKRGLQYVGATTAALPAGLRALRFTFVPREGDPISGTLAVDVPAGGRVALAVDTGMRARKLEVKLRR